MKKISKLVPIAIVLLFIGIAAAPSIGAQTPVKNEKNDVLTLIWASEDHKNDCSMKREITEDQTNNLNIVMDEFLGTINIILTDMQITPEEWETIRTITNNFIQSIKDILKEEFPAIDTDAFVQGMIKTLLGSWNVPNFRAPIFSIGRGIAWIPFYDYEAFFGLMLRPIFITHVLGFTAAFHLNMLPFRFEYGDRLGVYRYTTLGFTGLFINVGNVGFDRIVGPVLMIGRSYNMLGEDFP
jgi:hypothetical protein